MNYLYIGIGIAVTAVASPIVALVSLQYVRIHGVPPELPWTGLKNKRFFPKLRASLRESIAGREPMNEGYEKYSKHGHAFVVPGMHWPDVVLPPSDIAWIAAQPENVLSAWKVMEDFLAFSYLSHGPDHAARFDFAVIRRDVTRNLSKILPDIIHEINLCFDEKITADEDEWKEVKIFEIVTETSRSLANRLFVGFPLCRDKKYINGLDTWEIALGIASAVIRYLIPAVLKPWLAPIIAVPVRLQTWRLKRYLLPIIRHRIACQNQSVDSKAEAEQSQDVLQWLIDAESKRRAGRAMSMDDIAGKAIALNFFAVHTVAINGGSILTDILCYASAVSLISELREEAENVIPRLHSDPRAIREMIKLDSVIRESLRLNVMGSRGLGREVVAPQGVTTPQGLYLRPGTHLSIIVSSRQRDLDIWERADEFQPFRFVKGTDAPIDSEDKPRYAVHVTEDFLSFGYGPHACPGRFFAVQAMKILLGLLLIKYDFEPLQERPKSVEIGEIILPSDETLVKIRRRETISV